MVIALILAAIDPYNVIRQEVDPELQALKYTISYKLNYPLYQLQAYSYAPTDVIILGDSRAKALDSKIFETVTGETTINLSYGGGTVPEAVETFWYITENHSIKRVYLGLNFNLYNALNNKNRVRPANDIRANYISYLTSKYCIQSSALIVQSLISDEAVTVGKPKGNKEQFWKAKLSGTAAHYLQNYSYPKQYLEDLKKIVTYCKEHQIELVCFIPPAHTDLQDKVKAYHLQGAYDTFLKDLKGLNVPLLDFNFSNKITTNKENYGDPFHFKPAIGTMISKIVAGDTAYAKLHEYMYRQD